MTENNQDQLVYNFEEFNTYPKKMIQEYTAQLKAYKKHCYELDFKYLQKNNRLNPFISLADNYKVVKTAVNDRYSIFDSPILFVLNNKQEIYCTENFKFLFDRTNYQTVFPNYGYYVPTIEFIDSLYRILSFRDNANPYWAFIKYKYRNQASKCIFDIPEFFKIFDGNLFFCENPYDEISIKNSFPILLHEKEYRIPTSINNCLSKEDCSTFSKLVQPTFTQFRAIAEMLCSSESNRIPGRKYPKQIFEKKHPLQVQMIYILYHLQQQQYVKFPLTNLEDNSFVMGWQNILSANVIPPNVTGFLAQITNGSIASLDQLAALIARINLMRSIKDFAGIPPKLTVIMTSKPDTVKFFFDQLYPQPQNHFESVRTLCNKKSIIENILFKYNGGILQVCNHTSSVSLENLKVLKKLVKSIPLHIPDKAVGRLTYISNCHYVVIVDKQQDARIYQNFFQKLTEVIVLNIDTDDSQQSIIDFRLSKQECEWIHTILATHGLLCLDKETHHTSKKYSPADLNTVISSFLNECCIIEPNADCYAYTLYKIFCKYIKKNYGVKPVKKLHLIDELKTNSRFIYCRPRHRATEHGWGFRGIAIKEEKWDEYLNENISSHSHQVNYNVAEYLKEIDRTVRPLLGIKI